MPRTILRTRLLQRRWSSLAPRPAGPSSKDKLFWFVGYEGLRINIASVNSVKIPSSVGLTGGNPNLSLFDACNAVGRATVNPLSAKLAGLNDPASCTISPASNTVENVFPYNPTSSNLFYPGNPTTQPQNNGLAKVNWNLNQHNQLTGFYFVSKATQQGGGSLQPYWSTLGIENANEIAGSWTWTPNSTWVNELRGGVAWNSGNAVMADHNKLARPLAHWIQYPHGCHESPLSAVFRTSLSRAVLTHLWGPRRRRASADRKASLRSGTPSLICTATTLSNSVSSTSSPSSIIHRRRARRVCSYLRT